MCFSGARGNEGHITRDKELRVIKETMAVGDQHTNNEVTHSPARKMRPVPTRHGHTKPTEDAGMTDLANEMSVNVETIKKLLKVLSSKAVPVTERHQESSHLCQLLNQTYNSVASSTEGQFNQELFTIVSFVSTLQ
jgi:hypothetical protein